MDPRAHLAAGLLFALCLFPGRAHGYDSIRYSPTLPREAQAQCQIHLPVDSSTLVRALDLCLQTIRELGYAAASIDSLATHRDSLARFDRVDVSLFLGERYKLVARDEDTGSHPFCTRNLEHIAKLYAQRKGLEPEHRLRAAFNLQGTDTILVAFSHGEAPVLPLIEVKQHGDKVLNSKTLNRFLYLRLGDSLPAGLLLERASSLMRLPYLVQHRAAEVETTAQGQRLHLYLTPRNASMAEGSIGFAPDPSSQGKARWTADLRAALVNLLHRGESLDFSWKAQGKSQQHLAVDIKLPAILGSPLGLVGSLTLSREPNLEQGYNAEVGACFSLSPYQEFTSSLEINEGTSPRERPTSGTSHPPGEAAHVRTLGATFGFRWQRMVYDSPWPRGISLETRFHVGRREVRGQENSALLALELHANHARKWPSSFFLNTRLEAHAKFTPTPQHQLQAVEMLRAGGREGFLGYVERTIRTQAFAVLRLEPGFQLGDFLRTYAAASVGIFNQSDHLYLTLGAGLGVSFSIEWGEFYLLAARGHDNRPNQTPTPILLHLGVRIRF